MLSPQPKYYQPTSLNGVEDNEHFFLNCPLYYTYRLKLINIVNELGNFTLEILLYGDENLDTEQNCIIFQAVHGYIMDSGRFC